VRSQTIQAVVIIESICCEMNSHYMEQVIMVDTGWVDAYLDVETIGYIAQQYPKLSVLPKQQ
jgi:hypothetical protein